MLALALTSCPAPRDTVPETRVVHETREAPDAAAPPSKDGYAYVVRRPRSAVGLVGAHFMSDADAHRIVDRVADDLESCATRLEQRSELVDGAVQLVAVTSARGTADVTDIRFAPGGPVAANALECIVAPLRASAMPSPPAKGSAGVPAVAIEATWGPLPVRRGGSVSRPDAGGPL